MTINLDEAKAVRQREAKGEPVEVVFGEQTFQLPTELPFRTVDLLVSLSGKGPSEIAEIVTEIIGSLFGEEQAKVFLDLNPSLSDVMELINSLMADYGMSLPESEASPES